MSLPRLIWSAVRIGSRRLRHSIRTPISLLGLVLFLFVLYTVFPLHVNPTRTDDVSVLYRQSITSRFRQVLPSRSAFSRPGNVNSFSPRNPSPDVLDSRSCKDALQQPRLADFPESAPGAKAFLKALLTRQAILQRCMLLEVIPLRALVHLCLPHINCGGLGDRLRGAALALIISAITGRAFFIDHRKPSSTELSTYLEPSGAIDWRLSSLPKTAVSSMRKTMTFQSQVDKLAGGCSTWARKWYNMTATAVVGLGTNIPPTRACVAEFFNALLGQEAFSFISQIQEFHLTKLSLGHLFKPTALVKWYLFGLLAKLFKDRGERQFKAECTICFHIRTGKNMGTDHKVDVVHSANFDDFGRCGAMVESRFLRHQKSCSSKSWLVVTDHGNVSSLLKLLSAFSKNTPLITTSSSQLLIHIDRASKLQTRNKEKLNRALLHVFAEFHLLQQCRFLVMSPSMFSLTATLSGLVDDDAVRYIVPYRSECSLLELSQPVYDRPRSRAHSLP